MNFSFCKSVETENFTDSSYFVFQSSFVRRSGTKSLHFLRKKKSYSKIKAKSFRDAEAGWKNLIDDTKKDAKNTEIFGGW